MSSGTTEFLDYTGPVQKDVSVTNSGVRWNSKTLVDDVHKFNSQLIIPAFSFTAYPEATPGTDRPNCCVGQFNYTIPQNFSFSNWLAELNVISTLLNCYLVFRYRVGTKAFRYTSQSETAFESLPIFFPFYTGQLIKRNCTIEIWCTGSVDPVVVSNSASISLVTSILNNPAPQFGETTGPVQYNPLAFARHQDIGVVMPVALPIAWNPNQAWLSN